MSLTARLTLLGACLLAVPAAAQRTWTEVRTPHFTVITDGSPKDGRRLAEQFERFRAVLERLTRGGITRSERPVEVLAARDERSFRALAPQFWEGREQAKPAGLFLRGHDRLHVALRLDADRNYAEVMREAGYTANPYHTVFHEYVHALLQNNERLPLWLDEGLAEFYANSIIEDERVLVGKPSADSILYLRETSLMPLERLLQVTRESPEYRQEDLTARFYAQSWALLHYLRLGEKGALQPRLTAYRERIERGVDSLTAAREAWGDLDRFQQGLFRYIRSLRFYQEVMPGPTTIDTSGWTSRPLPVADAALARARFHAHMQRTAEAEALMAEAAAAGAADAPELHEVRALLQQQAGKSDEALASYQRALSLGSKSAMTHFEVARRALNGPPDVDRLREAQALLEKAIALEPTFAPAYAVAAEILLARNIEPQRAFEMGMRTVELMPGEIFGYLVAGRAVLRLDRPADAVTLARRALVVCDSEEERGRVTTLLREAERRVPK